MLLQLQHDHKPKKDTALPTTKKIKVFSKSKLNTIEQPTIQPEVQAIANSALFEGTGFNFHLQGLDKIHKESIKSLSSPLVVGIIQRKKFREQRIYEATVNTATDFINVHLRDMKPKLKQDLQTMLGGIHNDIEAGIWNGKYHIQQSRNKHASRESKDKKLVSLITNELVAKRMNSHIDLNEPSQEGYQQISVLVSNHAKTEIQKAKKAQQFVNKMRQRQAQRLEQLAKRVEERKIKELNSIQQEKAAQERYKQQKKALIKRRMAKQGQFISLERQRTEKINHQFHKMIGSYKKPLYQEIQERYNKSVVEDQKQNFHVLQKIKDERILNFEQINTHMQKYAELRQQQEDFRQQKRQLRESQQQVFASHRPRRSKFHSQILRETPKTDQLQYKASLMRRQAGYADYVRQNFIPRIDNKKKEQIQRLIKRISKQDTNGNGRRYMSHGKQNLQKLHMMIEQLRAKNQLKPTFQLESISMPKEVSKRYKNYLQQLKSADKNGKSPDYQLLAKRKDSDYLMLISRQKEALAQQKEKYLDSSIANINIGQHMEGNNIVEENYIDATRAKVALLKKYQLENSSPQIQQDS